MLRKIDPIIEAVCAGLMFTVVGVLFAAVVFRYVLAQPLGWSEEVARFALVWMTFLGAYLAFRRGAHIHINLLVVMLSARTRRRLAMTGNLLVALTIALLIRAGIEFASTFFHDPSPYIRFPSGLQYLALPVGGLLWLLALAALTKPATVRGPEEPSPSIPAELSGESISEEGEGR